MPLKTSKAVQVTGNEAKQNHLKERKLALLKEAFFFLLIHLSSASCPIVSR